MLGSSKMGGATGEEFLHGRTEQATQVNFWMGSEAERESGQIVRFKHTLDNGETIFATVMAYGLRDTTSSQWCF
jgi:hypothetical protein